MRILFIRPSMYNGRSKDAMQPLFAAALAAHTPKDIDVALFDDRIEEVQFDEPADLIAITIETFNSRRAYRIASKFRERGIKVIAGGYHASLLPDEVLDHVDSVFIGDAEIGWSEVIRDFRMGTLKKIYRNEQGAVGEIKFDRTIFEGKKYGPVELVQWGRGCLFNCDFCSIKAFYGKHMSFRSPEDITREIEGLARKTVFFVDDNLFNDREKFKTFLLAITPLKIKWTCQITINVARDDEILKLMKESGCFLVLIGIESFVHENLKQMKKSWSETGMGVERALKKLMDHGLLIYGTFIFGYDYDTKDSFKRAVDFAVRNKFFIANFNPLYPMPGTALYDRLKKQGRLIYEKWWLDPDFYYGKAMYYPKTLTPDELEDMCYQAKMEFNSWSSIIQRSLNVNVALNVKNLLLYMYANTTNRSEIMNKQGRPLGV